MWSALFVLIGLARPHIFGNPYENGLIDTNYCLYLQITGTAFIILCCSMLTFRSFLFVIASIKSKLQIEDYYKLSLWGYKVTITKSWFCRKNHLFTDKIIICICFFYVSIMMVFSMLFYEYRTSQWAVNNENPYCVIFADNVSMPLTIIGEFLEITVFIMLCQIKDNFKIAQESKMWIAWIFVSIILANTVTLIPMTQETLLITINWFWIVMLNGGIILAVFVPLLRFYFQTRHSQPIMWTMNLVLSNSELCEKFLDFLSKEFAAENLLFLLAIQQLKQSQDPRYDSGVIFEKFITKFGLYEVNLNEDDVLQIQKHFDQEEFRIAFDEAEYRIKELLEHDALVRFIQHQNERHRLDFRRLFPF